ncbi:hypothetical protein SLS60_000155 [Paraconiothyrium brasiliense]|uniref:Knr4/Smi1-like domain-containing protein n=1 Tax=Paraconiothyrium brasiliense TaxID=300254 RepID=A0ABR3S5L7_9PLEO
MSNKIELEKDDILHHPSRPVVYSKIRQLAKELAVLGKIDIASKITDLVLPQNRTGFGQIQFLNFAFEQTGDWPSTIPESARSKNALDELEISPSGSMDEKRYDELINQTEASQEDIALCLNIAVVLCEKRGKTDVEDIKQDERVVRVLEQIKEKFHYCISALTQYRKIWPLLASGAIAQQLGVHDAKLCATAEDLVETVRIRMEQGRQKGSHQGRPIKELLQILVENTRKNAATLYKHAHEDPPESYLHKPATEKDIEDLENRLQISGLPDYYKEFLLASNGLESVYDGHGMTPPLSDTQNVVYNKNQNSEKVPLQLVEDPTGTAQLMREYGYDAWPSATNQIEIGRMNENVYAFSCRSDVKTTIKAYKEALASDKVTDAIKVETIRAIEDQYGSMEAFEKMEWVMLDTVDFTPLVTIGTFQTWLEETARLSARPDDSSSEPYCLAYECSAKQARGG